MPAWVKPRKSKGYGFVDVGSEEEQKRAIAALDNKDPPHEDEGGGADTSAVALSLLLNYHARFLLYN